MIRFATHVLLVLLALIALADRVAVAQVFVQMGMQSQAGRLVEPPRTVLQQLRDAERAAQQERYGEAVLILGELLQRQPAADDDDELAGQDFFMDVGELPPGATPQQRTVEGLPNDARPRRGDDDAQAPFEAPVSKTLLEEARRMLSQLPPAALETYELRYGPQARQLLDNTMAQRDWSGPEEVRRRYFHTEAGRDATALLAQRALSLGRPLQTRRLLEALLWHPQLESGRRAAVRQLVTGLADGLGPEYLGEPSQQQRSDDAAGAAPAAALELQGLRPRRGTSDSDYTMLGGDPGRQEPAAGQLPLSIPRWVAQAAELPGQRRLLEEAAESMISTGDVAPPSWMPIKVGDQVLMRSTNHIFGVDFRSGKVIWPYPWFETAAASDSESPSILEEEDAGRMRLIQRVWNDIPYGRITSDGQRVYFLADLAEVESASMHPLMGFQGMRPSESASNSLIALDIATEGKLAWRIGGEEGFGEAGDIFFLGPPLPVGDSLYVLAELTGDIVLICLDAATGLWRWTQQLVAIEGHRVQHDPVRRIAGATPSYHEGVLVCATGAGVIVAVDVVDQSLMWAVRFERNEALHQQVFGGRQGPSPEQLLKRWWDGTPRIVGDTVFVTPIESDRLFALDLHSGEKRWKEIARSQKGARYLAGVRQRTMVLVGSDHVRGAAAATGKSLWATPDGWLEVGEQVSGVGVFGTHLSAAGEEPREAYFVPTTANRIIAVSTQDGSVLAARAMQFPTGNLIAVQGSILSQSATDLAAAAGQRWLQQQVEVALDADPDDFGAMVNRAELLFEDGQLEESLRWLQRARDMKPNDVHVENLLVDVMLRTLREDFSAHVDLLDQLEPLIQRPADAVQLKRLQIRAALDAGDPLESTRQMISLSQLVTADASLSGLNRAHHDPAHQVSLDHWLGARLAQAIAAAEPPEREQLEAIVADHLQTHRSAAAPLARRLLIHFGALTASEPLLDTLVQRYRQENQWLAMERTLLESAAASPVATEQLAANHLSSLAEVYALGGMTADAAGLLVELARREGAEPDPATRFDGLDWDEEAVAGLRQTPEESVWGEAIETRVPASISRRSSSRRLNRSTSCKIHRIVSRHFSNWQVISDPGAPLVVRDPLGNDYPIQLETRREEQLRQAVFSGGVMIVMLSDELVAVNLFDLISGQRNPFLWRRPWRTDGGSGVKSQSEATTFGDQVYRYFIGSSRSDANATELTLGPILGDSFYLMQGGELVAHDVVTGEPKWRNLETPRGGWIVASGDRVAVVSAEAKTVMQYDRRDGRLLSREPFEEHQIWTATDSAILAFRDSDDGKRELVLWDPIDDRQLLRHEFAGVLDDNRVFGRVLNGHHLVTLSSQGELLVWDLQQARQISQSSIDPIPQLSGVQVLSRPQMLVLLPNTGESAEESGAIVTTQSGQEHIRVDRKLVAISLDDGEPLWTVPLDGLPWGCTLSQATGSPLIVLSRSKSQYQATGSRTRSLDVMAIDARNGQPHKTIDYPVETINNDIESIVRPQPEQQRVTVRVGSLEIEYRFSDKAPARSDPDDEAEDKEDDEGNESGQDD